MKNIFMLFLISLLLGCSEQHSGKSKDLKVKESEKVKNDYHNKAIMEKIKIKIPDGLQEMTGEQLLKNYTEKIRPSIGYSNEDMSATLTFKAVPKGDNNLTDLMPVIVSQFNATYPQLKWEYKGMVKVNSKPFMKYEFISSATKKEVYSLVFITDIESDLFIITFGCEASQKEKWKPIIKGSMNSIKEIN